MRKRLAWWELSGFLWTAAAGTLLHFVYEWSGGSVVAAVLGAVNESVWEHMKLLVMAVMLFTAVQIWGQGHLYPNLPAVRTVSVLAGTLVIPVMYYTLTGAFGQQPTWVHISIFFWAAAGMFLLDHKLLQRGSLGTGGMQVMGFLVLWGLVFAFVWCTFRPPVLPLWRDPVTGVYGLG